MPTQDRIDTYEMPDGTQVPIRDSRVDNLAAGDVSYDNTESGLQATDVQDAIDELKSDIDSFSVDADQVDYDNSTSGLQATDVQQAIDEVNSKYESLPDPMVMKGTLGTAGTIQSLPVDGSANIGDTYKVITDGTYAGQAATIGDMFTCLTKTSSANTWLYIPSGDEPAQTAAEVDYSNTLSGLQATEVQSALDEIVSDMKGTSSNEALFHLGFYLDEHGGLCQVNSI